MTKDKTVTKDQVALKWRAALAEIAEILGMKCGDNLTDAPAKLREFIATQPRKSSDSYLPANTAGMLSGVTYVNTRDCAAMVSVSGGSLFVDGHQVPSPCVIPPGSSARAERGPAYTNFSAVMNYPVIPNPPSFENWIELKS